MSFFLSKALAISFAKFLRHNKPNQHPPGCLAQHWCWNKYPIMIKVDVGGHPPIPLRPPQLSLSVFSVSLIVAQFTIFGNFSSPKLPKPFWGPKRHFGKSRAARVINCCSSLKSCSTQIDISNEVLCVSNRNCMPKLRPWEVEVPIYPNRAHSLAFHLLGLGFWMFRVFHYFSTIDRPSSLIVT